MAKNSGNTRRKNPSTSVNEQEGLSQRQWDAQAARQFVEAEGWLRHGRRGVGVPESESEVEGTWMASLLMQGLFKVAYW